MTVTTPYVNQTSTYLAWKIAKNISFESLFWSERVWEIFLSIMFFENFVGMPLTCTPVNFSGAFFSNVKWCALSDYERKKMPHRAVFAYRSTPKNCKIFAKGRGIEPSTFGAANKSDSHFTISTLLRNGQCPWQCSRILSWMPGRTMAPGSLTFLMRFSSSSNAHNSIQKQCYGDIEVVLESS